MRFRRISGSRRARSKTRSPSSCRAAPKGCCRPHLTVFARTVQPTLANGATDEKRLSIGIAHTRDFLPEEIGRKAQIEETVKAVHVAMRDAGIDDPHDVHFVQIKCPLLTSERIEAALARGRKTVTTSAYTSMGYSRGASALGVARALGEIDGDIDEDQVLKDWDLFSSVASASAGIELMHNVVIVMGNSRFVDKPVRDRPCRDARTRSILRP